MSLCAPISFALATDNVVIAGVANFYIEVMGYRLSATNANQATWGSKLGSAATVAIDGPHCLSPNTAGQPMVASDDREPVFIVPTGAALILTLTAAHQVSGGVTYALRQNL